MRSKYLSVNFLNIILLLATFIIKFFTDVLLVSNGIGGFLVLSKYATLLAGIVCSLLVMKRRQENGAEIIFFREFKCVIDIIVVFASLSFVLIVVNDEVTSQTVIELGYMGLAILYSFCILNTVSLDDIYTCMKILLVCAVAAYAMEIGVSNITLSNFMNSNFNESYSPFESSYSASISMTLCQYFCYYRKEKKWMIASFVFCIATFKRLNIVFAFVFLLLPIIFKPDKKVSQKVINSSKIFFIIATVVLFYMYQDANSILAVFIREHLDFSLSQFTQGRTDLLTDLLKSGYKTFGLGSSTAFLGRSIEMDFIKIFIELGIIGLAVFICRFYDVAGYNIFCYVVMTENMLNFLTSHSLSSAFNWALRFILIGCITYKEFGNREERTYMIHYSASNGKDYQ